nr:NUDIX domain-containing protein [Desulfuromonadales bacterium]
MTDGPNLADSILVEDLESLYQGYLRIDHYRLTHAKFDGGRTPVLSRELMERGHAVALLPYDPVSDCVVLIEQFRIGAYAAGFHPWLVEIVAGIIDAQESPEAVARREAREETGLEIGRLEPIGHYLTSPGCTSESLRIYCGEVDSETAGGIHGLPDEGEDIRVFTLPFDEAAMALTTGGFTNFPIVLAMQWLMINRERVRSLWAT